MTYPPGVPVTLAQMAAMMPQLIQSVVLTSSQPSISINIPSGFNHLEAIWTARQDSTSGGAFCRLTLNNDTTAGHYTFQNFYGHGTTATVANGGSASSANIGIVPGPSDTANYFAGGTFAVGNIASAVFKPITGSYSCAISISSAYAGVGNGLWVQTAAVSSVQLLPSSGNLIAGSSLSIYGKQ